MSPDSVFTVDNYARSAIAASSIASGLGISCDAWFLLRYNWAGLDTFIVRPLCKVSTNYELILLELTDSRPRSLQYVYLLCTLRPRSHYLHAHIRGVPHGLPGAYGIRSVAAGRACDVLCHRPHHDFTVLGVWCSLVRSESLAGREGWNEGRD